VSENSLRFCGWSGFIFMALFGIGLFSLAQFIPPHRPTQTAIEIATSFRDNHTRILFGMTVLMLGFGFLLAFLAAVAMQMKIIENSNRHVPVWTTMFVLAQCFAESTIFLATTMWATIAYRPERAPELIQLINDFNWMLLVWPLMPPLVSYLAIGVVSLGDTSRTPVFPRWIGWLNIWMAVLALPAALTPFFFTGPFAWNGLFTFWLSAACYGVFVVVMSATLLGLAKKHTADSHPKIAVTS
jgi:hypothetical protein